MGANVAGGQSGHGLSGAQILAKLLALGALGFAIPDNVFNIVGSSDATKIARFEVDGLTTGTTRVYTLPDASITVAGINLAQTFTATQTFAGIDATSIGATTRGTGLFTTIGASGVITSTLATGTAPFTVASTTVVGNLNVSQLLGSTWAAPGSIGSGTPAAGAFTTLAASGAATLSSTLAVTGNAGIGGAVSSLAVLQLGATNPLTGTTQIGQFVSMTGTSAGTSALRGAQFSLATAAAAFTCPEATAFFCGSIALGAGSTITRATGAWVDPQSSGTNNCGLLISGSLSYTGNWAIRSESAYASYLAGALTVNGNIVCNSKVLIQSLSDLGATVQFNGSATYSSDTLSTLQLVNAAGTKLINCGFDDSAGIGFFQGLHVGTALKPIALNPRGASVLVGTATDNGTHSLQVGGAALLAAGTTGIASLRIPHGTAPSSPVNGDIWTTTAGLFVRINGATVGPLT